MEDTESAFTQTNIHTANIIFTNIILMADKHNIPRGNMHSNCRLLPDHIICKITQRNNIRRANTCDPALKLINEEITSDIQKTQRKPMEGTFRGTPGSQAQHAHSLEDHTRSIQQSTSTHNKHIHNIQQHNSNHTQTHCELFHHQLTNTVKHALHKTNRYTNRATHKIQGYNITLTTTHVQEAIKQSKNNNSQGPDKLNIRHLKDIGPLGLTFLTSMLKTVLTPT